MLASLRFFIDSSKKMIYVQIKNSNRHTTVPTESLTGRLAVFLSSPRFWKITKWSKATVLSVLGLTLVLSGK